MSTLSESKSSRESSWLSLLGDALRGRGGSPTEGSITRAIVLLAIPMVLEMFMESLFALVDIFFVSRLGAHAVAAVGVTESLLTLIYTVAIGLSIGVTAIVARRSGEQNPDAAATAAFQALVLGASLGILIGGTLAFFAPDLLRIMGAGEDVIAVGTGYARVALGGSAVVLLLFLMNAAFRGAADAAIAMRVLWLANGINIVLDPMLIYGIGPFPEMGVTGAAVATLIGRSIGVTLQLYILFYGGARLRVRRRHMHVEITQLLNLIRVSSSGILQVFIGSASWIGLVRVLSGFGSDALAGYTISIRIVLFALLPAWGLANAAATMVGQSLGAKDTYRAERAVWIAGHMNLAFLGSVGLIFVIFAPWIVSAFGGGAGASAQAIASLRIISAGFAFYAYGMVLNSAFNGAGDTWTPTLLNLFCFWLWEIPLAWTLSHYTSAGSMGVYLSVAIAFSTLAIAAGTLFMKGRWKLVKV